MQFETAFQCNREGLCNFCVAFLICTSNFRKKQFVVRKWFLEYISLTDLGCFNSIFILLTQKFWGQLILSWQKKAAQTFGIYDSPQPAELKFLRHVHVLLSRFYLDVILIFPNFIQNTIWIKFGESEFLKNLDSIRIKSG